MYMIGKKYKDKEGNTHTVILHNHRGKFPVITKDQRGVMHKFTHDGNYYANKESNKDLTGG